MTTREEMAEACAVLRVRCPCPFGDQKEMCPECQCMAETEDQLKRDGELRERLAAYANDLLESGDPEEAFIKREIGETIEALLKEFP